MFTLRHLIACLTFAATCGCTKTDPVAPLAPLAQSATGEPASVRRSGDTVAGVRASLDPTPADPNATAEVAALEADAAEETAAADYQPPFPDRIHLFLAPKREGKSTAANDQEEAVELLGFVNVRDSHKAVLSINGAVYPVAEGDTQFGVEVISIQPPGVVLQRGRQRWQASLEN